MSKYHLKTIYWVATTLMLAVAPLAAGEAGGKISAEIEASVAQLSSPELKITFLKSLISTEDSSDEANVRKSAAIYLLGHVSGTNVIDTLVKNIEFREKATGASPASCALVRIGYPAIPALLSAVESTPSTSRLRLIRLAATIQDIKQEKYIKFLEDPNGELSEKGLEKLKNNSVIIVDG